MNTILLNPSDVLFFRDGRPMGGSLSGHGAAWPQPSVVNHALHAALHRADMDDVHAHRTGRSGKFDDDNRVKKFGSLTTAGPYPVCTNGAAETWFFPRPLDATTGIVYRPVKKGNEASSLPAPLTHAVANFSPPSKDPLPQWWSEGAWNDYLGTSQRNELAGRVFHKNDSDLFSQEKNYGISISADTGTAEEGAFYSASYLRLKAGWRLGAFAEAWDKINGDANNRRDLINSLFANEQNIIVGGQQRVCTAARSRDGTRLTLPLGMTEGFVEHDNEFHVKWILLSPAIFPAIGNHPGGWLPSWVDAAGKVQLLDGPGKNYAKRHGCKEGSPIKAKLIASLNGKPQPVTGYGLPTTEEKGGAKSTHLAVPAGSVYYFTCASHAEAQKLAAALNWHGTSAGTEIQNRRSTLMGEKGFGLGVCSSWEYHSANMPT